MKFNYKSIFKRSLIILFLLTASQILFAQPGFEQGDTPDDPDNDIPIDGGISYLAAAGIAYGAKKIYDKRKKGEQ